MDDKLPINKFTLRFPPAFERGYQLARGERDVPGATRLLWAATVIGVVILIVSWMRIGISTIPTPSIIAQITLCALPPMIALALRSKKLRVDYPTALPRLGSIVAAACIGVMLAAAPAERMTNVFIMCFAVIIVLMVTPLTFPEHFLGLLAFAIGIASGLASRDSLDYPYLHAFLSLIVFASACLSISSYMLDRAQRAAYLSGLALEEEQEWSSKLLSSILPRRFSDGLRSAARDRLAIVESHAEVTIVFADLVGFTELATKLTPHRLVAMLNELFSRFDEITEKLGAEKIKTIGDAYLAVAGLTPSVDGKDHVRVGVDLALAFREAVHGFVAKDGTPLQIRIGVHTGPVVAGVIGTSRFHFDLWGETVNMAARLESSGVADEIQVSGAVRERLGNDYLVEPRRAIALKGIGDVDTFLLKLRRPT